MRIILQANLIIFIQGIQFTYYLQLFLEALPKPTLLITSIYRYLKLTLIILGALSHALQLIENNKTHIMRFESVQE